MRWLERLLRRDRLERQLDAELRDHIERLVALQGESLGAPLTLALRRNIAPIIASAEVTSP